MGRHGRETSALDELRQLLNLPKTPEYIESYDISNLAGGENVAGMIVFENGRPLKSAYRKFKIKTVVGQDDYSSMREVIRRRFEEYRAADKPEGFGRLPDLILLDGGKGHVGAIRPLLREMGIDVPVYGMVKDDKHRTRVSRRTAAKSPFSLPARCSRWCRAFRDEVHRFAIGYHRQQRKRRPSPPRSRPFRASAKRAPKR